MKRSRTDDDQEINHLSKHFKSTLKLTLGNSLAPQARIHAAEIILGADSNDVVEHISVGNDSSSHSVLVNTQNADAANYKPEQDFLRSRLADKIQLVQKILVNMATSTNSSKVSDSYMDTEVLGNGSDSDDSE